MTPAEALENQVMRSCRECVEWYFGDLIRLWSMIDFKNKMKLCLMSVGDIAIVSILLRNAHNCLNGCQTSSYFDYLPPELEAWLAQRPREMR